MQHAFVLITTLFTCLLCTVKYLEVCCGLLSIGHIIFKYCM